MQTIMQDEHYNKTFYSKTLHFVEKYTYIVHVATKINVCPTSFIKFLKNFKKIA